MLSRKGFNNTSSASRLVSLKVRDCSPRMSLARFLNWVRKVSSIFSRSARASAIRCSAASRRACASVLRSTNVRISISAAAAFSSDTRRDSSARRRASSAAARSSDKRALSRRRESKSKPSTTQTTPSDNKTTTIPVFMTDGEKRKMNELIRICKEIRQYNLPTAESRNRSVLPKTAERIPSCYKNRKIIPMNGVRRN